MNVSGNISVTGHVNNTGIIFADGSLQKSASAMFLLRANNGSDTTTTATIVDSVNISGLTERDTIIVYYNYEAYAQGVGITTLRHVTDDAQLVDLNGGGNIIAAGETVFGQAKIRQASGNSTRINAESIANSPDFSTRTNTVRFVATTPWTDAWTLGLRHNGVTSGGTLKYSWAVYKLLG